MKKLIKRLKADTPILVKYLQVLLMGIAGYNVIIVDTPFLLKIVPDGWETNIAAASSLAAMALQFINKRSKPDMPNEVVKE